jgi:serine palmitoyltransferase
MEMSSSIRDIAREAQRIVVDVIDDPAGAPERYFSWVQHMYQTNPTHVIVETALIVVILYILLFKRSYNPRKKGFGGNAPPPLSKAEVEELIDEWEPEPLVDPRLHERYSADATLNEVVLESGVGPLVRVEGSKGIKVNLASYDFLGLAGDKMLKDAARACLLEYGCGSCGPRGFYGTTLAHLELEKRLAEHYDAEEAICYSDSTSTITSVIPCFAKRGDVLVIDSGVSHPLLVGAQLSRAKTHFFQHNDMEDLERVLEGIKVSDRKAGRPHGSRRHFIIVEGLFRDHGDFCPLEELVDIKTRHCCRLVVDDSFACFAMGAAGKGSLDFVDGPGRTRSVAINEVDLFTGSCATSLSSVGGFAVGKRGTVNYQRLAGAAYCFSASQPPFTAAVCVRAMALCSGAEGRERRERLRENALRLRSHLDAGLPGAIYVAGGASRVSPMMHLRLAPDVSSGLTRNECNLILQDLAARALREGAVVTRCVYTPPTKHAIQKTLPPPSVRLCVSAGHAADDIDAAATAILTAAEAVIVAAGLPLTAPRASPKRKGRAKVSRSSTGKNGKKRSKASAGKKTLKTKLAKEKKKKPTPRRSRTKSPSSRR